MTLFTEIYATKIKMRRFMLDSMIDEKNQIYKIPVFLKYLVIV